MKNARIGLRRVQNEANFTTKANNQTKIEI